MFLLMYFYKIASWWSLISNNLILKEISISNTKIIEKNEFYDLLVDSLGNH